MKKLHRLWIAVALVAALAAAGGWIVLRKPPDGGRIALADAKARLAAGDARGSVASAELAFRTLYGSGEAASVAALARAAIGDLPVALGRLEAAARRDPENAEAALEAGLLARFLARTARNGPQLRERAARWIDEASRRVDAGPSASFGVGAFSAQALGVATRIAAGDPKGALARLDTIRPEGAAEVEQVVLLRAAAEAERGAFDEALRVVRAAIDASPTPRLAGALARIETWRAAAAEPAIVTGLRAWSAHDADLAARALERWVDVHPDDAAALAVLAAALARTGRDDAAAKRYETLAARPPPRVAALFFRGCHALASGRPSEAVDALEMAHALADGGATAPVVTTLAVARAAVGDDRRAEEAFREALRTDASYVAAADRLADLLVQQGRAEAARDVVHIALGAAPASVPLRLRLARIALASGDRTAAELILDAVLRDAPDLASGHVLRGAVLAARGAADDAASAFQAALRADPVHVEAHLGLLGLARSSGSLPQRLASIEALAAARPGDARLMFVGGAAAELTGDLERAERGYRCALDADPDSAFAANNLAWLLGVRLGRPADARPYAERALRLQPRDPRVLDTAGWLRHLCGDTAAAEPLLRRARAALPRDDAIGHRLTRVTAELATSSTPPERTPR